MFTAQAKGGSPAGEHSEDYGLQSSKTVEQCRCVMVLPPPALSFPATALSLVILAGFFLSEWYHCFLNPWEMYPVQALGAQGSCSETWGQK